MPTDTFSRTYLAELRQILETLDPAQIDAFALALRAVRDRGGRLFILGVGGSAANASHAVNDFRKITHFEAYAPTDNIAELTARTNDDGWHTIFCAYLITSHFTANDALLILSVGGGSARTSQNLVHAASYAREIVGATIFGIVGRDGGFTRQVADYCLLIPAVNPAHITAHTESIQAVLWHLLVNHPALAL